ncbi:MAG: choice-of-anchor L domain-containing protein [Polyangiaceae bacterium]
MASLSMTGWFAGLAGGVALAVVACGDDRPLPPPHASGTGGSTATTCIDNDGDGFGPGCAAGPDCNDQDPATTECDLCAKPRPGCPCTTPGERFDCGKIESKVETQLTCGFGEMVCQDGKWGECIVNNSITLLPGGDPKTPGSKSQALNPPASCQYNPCDPYCVQWPDTTENLPADDGGTITTDAGLTLPTSDAAPPVAGSCSGGSIGNCTHHLCQPGAALASGCDTALSTPACVPSGTACSATKPCCLGLGCVAGTCQPVGKVVLWGDDFSAGNAQGWTLDTEWGINHATVSTGQTQGNPDPAQDFTPSTGDEKVAGVVIGGNTTTSTHNYYWFTSPNINTSAASGPMKLAYRRWLNSDAPNKMVSRVDVSKDGGSNWSTVWQNGTSIADSSWEYIQHDITSQKAAQMKIRFGVRVVASGAATVSSWNLDDVEIVADANACQADGATCANGQPCCTGSACVAGKCASPAPTSCVAQVCASNPGCCTTAWSSTCVNAVATLCGGAACAADQGTCVFCYADSLDHDGDGYSFEDGDCRDCDPLINPGALDFPGNGLDEDCSGVADDEVASCDTALAFTGNDPKAYARAMELCRFSTTSAKGKKKTWGVLSSSLTQANGSECSNSLQRAVTPQFGTNNLPKAGTNMAVFSSGTARDTNDPGYVNPNGQSSSYNANTFATPPSGFPKNAAGCPNGTAAYDSCGLTLELRAPTNAKSFAFDFDFFSSEYSEWVCTQFNDSFIALYSGALNPYADKNISFDSLMNPVSVNVGFFSIPGDPNTTSHPHLDGTGFGGYCNNSAYGKPSGVCGGATGWLTTTAPVNPGEIIQLHYAIWDTGDHVWDSTVLLDHFRWSAQTSTISTQPALPSPPPVEYAEGSFVRTYDANEGCAPGSLPLWGHWSWTSSTPNDSRIEYYVKAASTAAGLATAVEHPLAFTNPPGPSSLAGSPAVAHTNPIDTQNGSAVVTNTLALYGLNAKSRFVQVRSRLVPSSDKLSAPTLHAWNLEVSCQPGE